MYDKPRRRLMLYTLQLLARNTACPLRTHKYSSNSLLLIIIDYSQQQRTTVYHHLGWDYQINYENCEVSHPPLILLYKQLEEGFIIGDQLTIGSRKYQIRMATTVATVYTSLYLQLRPRAWPNVPAPFGLSLQCRKSSLPRRSDDRF